MASKTKGKHQVDVDPRMKHRWIQARREEGQRRLRLLVVLGVAVGAILVGFALLQTPLFNLDRITVTGAKNLSAEQVTTSSGLRRGRTMLSIDTKSAADRLREVPRIGRVNVERHWPDTVTIDITERQEVAVIGEAKSGWTVIDRDGRSIARFDERPPDLPALEGVKAAPQGRTAGDETRQVAGVAALIPKSVADRVSLLTRQGDGTIELEVNGTNAAPAIVRFGPIGDAAEKMTTLETLLQKVDFRGVTVVDVRVPSAPVLTR